MQICSVPGTTLFYLLSYLGNGGKRYCGNKLSYTADRVGNRHQRIPLGHLFPRKRRVRPGAYFGTLGSPGTKPGKCRLEYRIEAILKVGGGGLHRDIGQNSVIFHHCHFTGEQCYSGACYVPASGSSLVMCCQLPEPCDVSPINTTDGS